MHFRNPWIDPRVTQVRSAAVRAYLLAHGWTALPAEQPNLLPFESPAGEDAPAVRVPVMEDARDYPQRMVELLTDVALAEDRYAVEVLNDILQQQSAVSTNGTGTLIQAEPTAR